MIGVPCCREMTRLVCTEELARAPWYRRACARLHLLVCRDCRAYCTQMRRIGQTARELYPCASEDADALLEALRKR